MNILVFLFIAGSSASIPSISSSCNSITIQSELVLQNQPTQQRTWYWGSSSSSITNPPIKIAVATQGRVLHPYSPSGNQAASLLVGSEVGKHLFSISESNATQDDKIRSVKVSMTDHQILSTIFYTTNSYSEIAPDPSIKTQRSKGVHVSYYCASGAYGIVPVNMTIEFQRCPDMFIWWRKQCGTSQNFAKGLNLDILIGGSGHQRFSLIEGGVQKITKRSLEAKPPEGYMNIAGLEVEKRQVKDIKRNQHFLQTKNHEELSFLLYNNEWTPFTIDKIEVSYEHSGYYSQKVRTDDFMMPVLFGPGAQNNIRVTRGTQVPFVLQFNCLPGKEGEGWVLLTIHPQFFKPFTLQFEHKCAQPISFTHKLQEKLKKAEKVLIHDLVLVFITLLLGATLILLIWYIFYTQREVNVLSRAKSRIKRQAYLAYVKLQSMWKKWKAARRKPRLPEHNHELQLIRDEDEEIAEGFKLEEDTPLTIEKREKSYGSLE